MEENAFVVNVDSEIAAILYRPQYVDCHDQQFGSLFVQRAIMQLYSHAI